MTEKPMLPCSPRNVQVTQAVVSIRARKEAGLDARGNPVHVNVHDVLLECGHEIKSLLNWHRYEGQTQLRCPECSVTAHSLLDPKLAAAMDRIHVEVVDTRLVVQSGRRRGVRAVATGAE